MTCRNGGDCCMSYLEARLKKIRPVTRFHAVNRAEEIKLLAACIYLKKPLKNQVLLKEEGNSTWPGPGSKWKELNDKPEVRRIAALFIYPGVRHCRTSCFSMVLGGHSSFQVPGWTSRKKAMTTLRTTNGSPMHFAVGWLKGRCLARFPTLDVQRPVETPRQWKQKENAWKEWVTTIMRTNVRTGSGQHADNMRTREEKKKENIVPLTRANEKEKTRHSVAGDVRRGGGFPDSKGPSRGSSSSTFRC